MKTTLKLLVSDDAREEAVNAVYQDQNPVRPNLAGKPLLISGRTCEMVTKKSEW